MFFKNFSVLLLILAGCSYCKNANAQLWSYIGDTPAKEKAVVNRAKIKNSNIEYCKSIKLVINENVQLMRQQPTYRFRILFSGDHNLYEDEQYNFALITTKHNSENLIFKPIRYSNKKIKETEITFHKEDRTELEIYQEKLANLEEEWETQKINGLITEEKNVLKEIITDNNIILKLVGHQI